jgi:hypothetical protein
MGQPICRLLYMHKSSARRTRYIGFSAAILDRHDAAVHRLRRWNNRWRLFQNGAVSTNGAFPSGERQ